MVAVDLRGCEFVIEWLFSKLKYKCVLVLSAHKCYMHDREMVPCPLSNRIFGVPKSQGYMK